MFPEEKREDFRLISRLRETLMRENVRKGKQIKSLLHQLGEMPNGKATRVSAQRLKLILQKEFSSEQRFCLGLLIQQWLEMEAQIKNISKQLSEQAKKDGWLESIYRSAPGVGLTTARTLINELGDMRQFANERAF